MATPLNKIYPAENRKLADDILDYGGCWISELSLGGQFHRSSFVQRDRIQSGLSVAVIPVQTDVEGGTMHTVRYAEQQGRLLLCPRPIEAEQSMKQYAGVRHLIETRRAIPFSGDEYTKVLEYLVDSRDKLAKAPPQPPKHDIAPPERNTHVNLRDSEVTSPVISVAASAEEPPTEAEAKPETKPKRRRRSRLQTDFEFIEEPPTGKRKKASGKKEREIQIRLLEQLRDEIGDAKRPDGGSVSDVGDMKLWLEEKIRALRKQD
jgi:hypothetical protein